MAAGAGRADITIGGGLDISLELGRSRAAATSVPFAGDRAAGAFVFALVFASAALLALVQPVWSRVDEAQHADFIAHLAQASWPVEGQTRILQSTADQMAATGTYRWQLPGREPLPTSHDAGAFSSPPAGASAQGRAAWTQRNLWTYSYEAAQPPLFYLLATPVWMAAGAAGGETAAVHAVRLVNALLLAGLAVIAFASGRRLGLGTRGSAAAGLVAGLVPGLVLNGSAVTNDTLAAVLGAACVLWAMVARDRGWGQRAAILGGALLGLALLAKVTAAGAGVALLVSVLMPGAARPLRRRLMESGLVLGTALVLIAPWLFVNVALYRRPTAAREVDRLLGTVFETEPLSARYLAASVKNGFATFWSGEPWNSLPINRPLTALALAWVVLACFGVARGRRSLGAPALIAATGVAGSAAWAIVAMRITGVGGLLPGRYLYPMAAALAGLLVLGTIRALPRRWPLVAGAYVVLAAGDIAGFALGWSADHLTDLPPPAPTAGRAASVTAASGGAVLTVDRVVRDPAAGRLWLHVTVSDRSPEPLEWWPIAELTRPGSPDIRPSNFSASSRFGDRLASGQSVAGWVLFDKLPSAEAAGAVHLRYRALTTDGYRTLDDLAVTID